MGGSKKGRLSKWLQQTGRRIKTAYVPETENLLVYLDRKQDGDCED